MAAPSEVGVIPQPVQAHAHGDDEEHEEARDKRKVICSSAHHTMTLLAK